MSYSLLITFYNKLRSVRVVSETLILVEMKERHLSFAKRWFHKIENHGKLLEAFKVVLSKV